MTTIATPAPKFRGITTRGRQTLADSLQAALDDVAYLERHTAAACVTAQGDVVLAGDPTPGYVAPEPVWYAYASQAALDADLARGPITGQSPGWFAVIRCE